MGVRLDDEARDALAVSRLGALPAGALGELLVGATRLTIPARSTIRPVAGRSPHLELVVSGLVRIQVAARDGRALTVRYCRRGALMGAATLYAEAVRPFTIEALTDAELLRLDPARMVSQARRDPRVANALLAETSERVDRCTELSIVILAGNKYASGRHQWPASIASVLSPSSSGSAAPWSSGSSVRSSAG